MLAILTPLSMAITSSFSVASEHMPSLQHDLQKIVDEVAAKYNCSVSLGVSMPNDMKLSAAGGLCVPWSQTTDFCLVMLL